MTIKKPVRTSCQNDIINMQEIVRQRLKSAIEAKNNELAKVEIDLLERLLKLNKFEDISPPKLTSLEIRQRREKLINEIEAKIQKLSK